MVVSSLAVVVAVINQKAVIIAIVVVAIVVVAIFAVGYCFFFGCC